MKIERLILLCSLILLAACRPAPTPTVTPTPTRRVVATFWTALLIGKLEMADGCLHVVSRLSGTNYILVPPPDMSITVEGNRVRFISGIVTGIRAGAMVNLGETVKMGGGETSILGDDLIHSIPPNCTGRYWIVSPEVTPYEATREPN
jgi:hypothetical protein